MQAADEAAVGERGSELTSEAAFAGALGDRKAHGGEIYKNAFHQGAPLCWYLAPPAAAALPAVAFFAFAMGRGFLTLALLVFARVEVVFFLKRVELLVFMWASP